MMFCGLCGGQVRALTVCLSARIVSCALSAVVVILRLMAGAKSQAFHLHMPFIALYGDCALLAVVSDFASRHRCGVRSHSCGYIFDSFVRRLRRAALCIT